MNVKTLIASSSVMLLSTGAALAQNNTPAAPQNNAPAVAQANPQGTTEAVAEIARPERPFRASIGLFGPTGSSFRRATGSVLPMINLGYDVGKTQSNYPWIWSLYLDFATNRKNGTTNSFTAFGVSGRHMIENPNGTNNGYFGAGIGSYDVKIGTSNSKIGGKIFGGFERNSGYFVEAAYHWMSKINGFDPSGLSVSVGRRF